MGRLETLVLKNVKRTSLNELELSRVPTLRKLDIYSEDKGDSLSVESSNYNPLPHLSVESSNYNPLPQLQPHRVEMVCLSYSFSNEYTSIFDHFLESLLSGNTLAHITSLRCNYDDKDDGVYYAMLPSLPKLILGMERLNTLELGAKHDTALAKLVPVLFATPTLKNVAVYSNSGTYKKEIPEPTDNGPINGTIHCSPNYDSGEYECICMIDGILQQWPQYVLSHVTSFFFDFDVGSFKCSINVDSCSDKPLPQLQPHHVYLEDMCVCDSEISIQLFNRFLLQLLPDMILACIELFSYSNEIEDELSNSDQSEEDELSDSDQSEDDEPYLPKLIPKMERLNLLRLKNLTLHNLNSQDIALLFQWQPTYQLETLKLPCLSPDRIEMVSRSLTTVSSLKTLGIQRSKFTLQSMQAFVSMLQHKQSLTEVNISDCSIDGDIVCCLAKALHHNKTLRKLDMSKSPVGKRGALAIAEMLKHNTTLEELDFSNTKISSDGAVGMAKALHHNTTLRKLSMNYNPVGERGQLAMAEMLKHNNTLEMLVLNYAKVNSNGAVAMAKALHHNTALRKLNMRENPVRERGVGQRGTLAMAKMLKHNTTLEELDCRWYTFEVGDKAIKTLIVNLAVNLHLKKLVIHRGYKELVESIPVYHDHKERVVFE